MGGMVLETNMNEIITQVDAQNKMEKSEVSTCLPGQRMYDLIFTFISFLEVLYTVCRHVCMLHPACYSPVTLWMLPTTSVCALLQPLFLLLHCSQTHRPKLNMFPLQFEIQYHSHHLSLLQSRTVPLSDTFQESYYHYHLN